MFLKENSLMPLFAACCCILSFCCSEASTTYCSLDRMKKFAMEACEHLFEFEAEVRERRSLDYGSKEHRDYINPAKYSLNIRRSIYPIGGYLKVGQEHYKKLSLLDVSPRYKAKKTAHIMNEKKMRSKRDDKDFHNYSNNISYCCYHKCEEDFFC